MKVILQQDVKGQGKKGQLVDVSDGYARNFLLPKKLAVIATAENLNTMKQQEKARKAQEAAEKAEAEATAKKLEGLTVKIGRQGRRGRTALRRRHRQGGLRGPGQTSMASPLPRPSWFWTSPSRHAAAIRFGPSWAMRSTARSMWQSVRRNPLFPLPLCGLWPQARQWSEDRVNLKFFLRRSMKGPARGL